MRLIGIDAPETGEGERAAGCFGKQAQARLRELLPRGESVRLVAQKEPRDRFDRLLFDVYRARDDLFVNLRLVEDGYAVPIDVRPNLEHRRAIHAAADRARERKVGLWGQC